jgi:preprotein translocase subunit SecE
MGSRNTFVALFFVATVLLLTLVLDNALQGIMALSDVPNAAILGDRFTVSTLIGLALSVGAGLWCWVNPKTKNFISESVDELAKVSWPDLAETRMNTVVVIVFSFIAAAILGVFDSVFSWLTNNQLFLR